MEWFIIFNKSHFLQNICWIVCMYVPYSRCFALLIDLFPSRAYVLLFIHHTLSCILIYFFFQMETEKLSITFSSIIFSVIFVACCICPSYVEFYWQRLWAEHILHLLKSSTKMCSTLVDITRWSLLVSTLSTQSTNFHSNVVFIQITIGQNRFTVYELFTFEGSRLLGICISVCKFKVPSNIPIWEKEKQYNVAVNWHWWKLQQNKTALSLVIFT